MCTDYWSAKFRESSYVKENYVAKLQAKFVEEKTKEAAVLSFTMFFDCSPAIDG